MARGDVFEVLWCPPDPYLSPVAPAYSPGDTQFTKSDMAGMLADGYAPVGMVVRDIEGRVWTVWPIVDDGQRELVLLGSQRCGEGYCIRDPQVVMRAYYNGQSMMTPKEEQICEH
jgi:hypothetical protein